MANPAIKSSNSAINGASPGDPTSQADQAKYQIVWDKTMTNATKFVRYEKVGVLLLSWDDTCDDLKTRQEVDDLETVFKGLYNFEVRKEKLHHKERAQAQMNEHLATFVRKYEKESDSTLMIIYYAGHGWSDGSDRSKRTLRLAGTTTNKQQHQLERNSVMWERAESNIQGADADVLLIFDCCNAGMISRSGHGRRFQTLGACSPDAKTRIPGETSFTSALIWALKKLHGQEDLPYFPSSTLRRTITEAPRFPADQHPVLSDRLPNLDHIVIAPLTENNTPLAIPVDQLEDPSRAAKACYFDVRFHCFELSEKGLENIAIAQNKLLMDRELLVRRIDFLGMNSIWDTAHLQPVLRIARFWYETTKAKRQAPERIDTAGHISQPPTPDPDTPGSSEDGMNGAFSTAPGIDTDRNPPPWTLLVLVWAIFCWLVCPLLV